MISDQYQRHEVPEHRLYMIDKVVRMRSQYGRFGIDHSELLNYELELTNKPRDDHMNWLVQKRGPYMAGQSDISTGPDSDEKKNMNVSAILFNRLNVKDEEKEHSIYSNTKTKVAEKVDRKQTYANWLKAKEAERRLKRKLILQAQTDVKDQLLQIAKSEKDKQAARIKAMEDWLMTKKLEEAERIAHLQNVDSRDEILGHSQPISFKGFLRSQEHKKRLSKKQANSKYAKRLDDKAREMAAREMDEQIMHKQA